MTGFAVLTTKSVTSLVVVIGVVDSLNALLLLRTVAKEQDLGKKTQRKR